MFEIDRTVRMVVLQFSFSSNNIVPEGIREEPFERIYQQEKRRARGGTGKRVIDPVQNVSLKEIGRDLRGNGFELVDAFRQKRHHPDDHRGRRMYQVVRFSFAKEKFERTSPDFQEKKGELLAYLGSMVVEAAWRVRVFLNPFFKDGEEMAGAHHLSINLEARHPLFDSEGKRRLVWRKDEAGRKLGNAKILLQPDHCLRIKEGVIEIR